MKFDDILLALIARRPRSGYDLRKWLDVEGIFIRANADQSQIYRSLRRLQQKGLVLHTVTRKSGPDAKIFEATKAGIKHLRELAKQPYVPAERRQEPDFSARITLLGPYSIHHAIETVDVEIAFRLEQIARFRNRPRPSDIDESQSAIDPDLAQLLANALDLEGQRTMDQWIIWLKELRAQLSSYQNSPEKLSSKD